MALQLLICWIPLIYSVWCRGHLIHHCSKLGNPNFSLTEQGTIIPRSQPDIDNDKEKYTIKKMSSEVEVAPRYKLLVHCWHCFLNWPSPPTPYIHDSEKVMKVLVVRCFYSILCCQVTGVFNLGFNGTALWIHLQCVQCLIRKRMDGWIINSSDRVQRGLCVTRDMDIVINSRDSKTPQTSIELLEGKTCWDSSEPKTSTTRFPPQDQLPHPSMQCWPCQKLSSCRISWCWGRGWSRSQSSHRTTGSKGPATPSPGGHAVFMGL